jgi:hypothetical protein
VSRSGAETTRRRTDDPGWDAEGWQSFVSDPEVPPIMKEAGHKGSPQAAELGGHYDA